MNWFEDGADLQTKINTQHNYVQIIKRSSFN